MTMKTSTWKKVDGSRPPSGHPGHSWTFCQFAQVFKLIDSAHMVGWGWQKKYKKLKPRLVKKEEEKTWWGSPTPTSNCKTSLEAQSTQPPGIGQVSIIKFLRHFINEQCLVSPPSPWPPLPAAYRWRSLSICSRACSDCWPPSSWSLPSWLAGWSLVESHPVSGCQNLGSSPRRSQKTSSASRTPAPQP